MSITTKLVIILIVLAIAGWFVYPPSERIALGLDLRGGSHIVMQVDTNSAIKYELDLIQSRLGQALKDKGLSYTAIASPELGVLEIQGTDPGRRADVRQSINDFVGQWDIRDGGNGAFRATMPMEARQAIEKNAVDTTINTMRNRVDELGVREPILQKQGSRGDRILIELPGVEDPERAKKVIQEPALLEWKAVTYPPGISDYASWGPPESKEALVAQFGGTVPSDTDLYPQRITVEGGGSREVWWPLKRVSTVMGNDLRTARRGTRQFGDATVDFTLTRDAGRRFEIATRENLGRKMAIVLGGPNSKHVISAPVIQGVIREDGFIQGNFSVQTAEDLALQLRSGSIPTDVAIIEERTVGPSLGRDSIRQGILASLVGFAAVAAFMLVYYRLAGVNAIVALFLNVVLLLGAMGYFGSALTLPGIAGLILTVGMAVDSNVLIFERIREELRLGKTVRSAVDQGFGRAFWTIVDVHVTTLVSSLVLLNYGTGPVRGFAVTLIIGLLASMFTSVFVSRTLFDIVLGRGRKVESLSI